MSAPAPIPGVQRSKDGTRARDVVSYDGGKTWVLDVTEPEDPPAATVTEAEDAAAGRANMADQERDPDRGGALPPMGEGAGRGSAIEQARARLAEMTFPEPVAEKPPMTPLAAFSTMLPQGLTLGGGDEVSPTMGATPSSMDPTPGMLPSMPSKPAERPGHESATEDIPKTYAGGGGAADQQQRSMRADIATAEEEDPAYMGTAGKVIGGGLATAPLAAFGIPGGMAARAGAAALEGGALGAAEGALSAEEGQRLEGAKTGGLVGGLTGGAVGALPLDKVAREVGDWASRKRLTSTGVGAGDYGKLVSQGAPGKVDPGDIDAVVRKRTTGPEAMGEAIEDVGLTGGVSTRGYWKRAERMKAEAGQEIGAIVDDLMSGKLPDPPAFKGASTADVADDVIDAPRLDVDEINADAGPRPVVVELGPVAANLRKAAAELDPLATPEAGPMAEALMKRAEMFETAGEAGSGMTDYKTAWETRVLLDKLSFDAHGQKNGIAAEQLRKIAGDLQQQLEASVAKNRPELLKPLREANKRYSTADKVANYSGGAQGARETGDPSVGETNLARSSPGAAGFLAGLRSVGDRAGAYTGRGVQQGLAAFPAMVGLQGAQMYPEDLETEE